MKILAAIALAAAMTAPANASIVEHITTTILDQPNAPVKINACQAWTYEDHYMFGGDYTAIDKRVSTVRFDFVPLDAFGEQAGMQVYADVSDDAAPGVLIRHSYGGMKGIWGRTPWVWNVPQTVACRVEKVLFADGTV